ncbi:MAG: class I SAM-dependent methyltransferase [Bacteroidetes bacterium]|nr:MAG: class I SAM-dependent methyltransferase [Bacteroidota bacterium]
MHIKNHAKLRFSGLLPAPIKFFIFARLFHKITIYNTSVFRKMNYKLLFPTYRNRYLFVKKCLQKYGANGFPNALNLGTGEGDYDPMIAPFCGQLTSCDINERDIAFAARLNAGVPNLQYTVENALDLSFPDARFDLIVSVDVMEHVGKPDIMTAEIGRVLKKGGLAFITFPQIHFPFTYDPVNRFLSWFTDKKIPQGAYAFGHEYLIDPEAFKLWAQRNGLEIVEEHPLSGYLIALLEMYWTGIIQSIFKDNARNLPDQTARKIALRPSTKAPWLVGLTDAIIAFDRWLFGKAKHSVGKGFVVRKK